MATTDEQIPATAVQQPLDFESILMDALRTNEQFKQIIAQSNKVSEAISKDTKEAEQAAQVITEQTIQDETSAAKIFQNVAAQVAPILVDLTKVQTEFGKRAVDAAKQLTNDESISFWSDPIGAFMASFRKDDLQKELELSATTADMAHRVSANLAQELSADKVAIRESATTINDSVTAARLKQLSAITRVKAEQIDQANLGKQMDMLEKSMNGDKDIISMLNTYYNKGMQEEQVQIAREHLATAKDAEARQASGQQFTQDMEVKKEKRMQAGQDFSMQQEIANANMRYQQFKLSQGREERISDKQAAADETNKQFTQGIRNTAISIKAPISLSENPDVAMQQLELYQKNPSTKRIVDALAEVQAGFDGQLATGTPPERLVTMFGSDPYTAYNHIESLSYEPNAHTAEQVVIKQMRFLLQDLKSQQVEGIDEKTRLPIKATKINDKQSEQEKAAVFNEEVRKKFFTYSQNVERDGIANPYAPVPFQQLGQIGGFNQTPFYTDVIAPLIKDKHTDNSAEHLVALAIEAANKGQIKDVKKTLMSLFEGISRHNNLTRQYVGKGLPSQNSYRVSSTHPLTGTTNSYDLMNDAQLGAYIKYIQSISLIKAKDKGTFMQGVQPFGYN